MTPIFSIFTQHAYIIWPNDWLSIVVFLTGVGGIFWANWHWRGYQGKLSGERRFVFWGLLIFSSLFALIFGIRLPLWGGLSLPGVAMEASYRSLMIFSFLPAVFGGWYLGPQSASIFGALTGLSLAYFDTHSPFTILEYSFLAILFSVATRQPYRTWLFRALRRPFWAAFLLSAIYPLFFIVGAISWVSGSMAESLDFAISNSFTATVAVGASLLVAGLITEIIINSYPKLKGAPSITQPSPAETSLRARFLGYVVWSAIIIIVVLITVNWFVAGRSAKEILRDQMASLAQTSTDQIPRFLNTGQSLIKQYASDLSGTLNSYEEMRSILEKNIRFVPFFSRLFVLGPDAEQLAAFPQFEYSRELTSVEEQNGLHYALVGIPVQVYTISSLDEALPAEISFLGAILDEDGKPQGILVGRVELIANSFTQVIIDNLQRMEKLGGGGFLLDDEGQLLYASDVENALVGLPSYEVGSQEYFYEGTMANGTRQLVYTQKSLGRPWRVLLTIPASQAQELALNLAAPMSGVIFGLGLLAMVGLYVGLNAVAGTLHNLMEEADLITKGHLDHELHIGKRIDEVGQLRRSFEKMRQVLRARMRELNRLLKISRGVASTLDIEEAIQPILESALETGASSARIVLAPEVIPGDLHERSEITSFGKGPTSMKDSVLDSQIMDIVAEQPHLRLQNPSRVSQLKLEQVPSPPGAILGVALRDEQQYYGVLWLSFKNSHIITDEETRFIVTLAGQTTIATTNAQLFMRAEVGRQRLAAILTSTPDPVLVTDYLNHLLLANPAAGDVLDVKGTSDLGHSIEELTTHSALVDLLSAPQEDQHSVEITLDDGRVFLAIASPVVGDGKQFGRVCVLRDITRLKEMDESKSNFVATVSHDLRSPLTLIRGYATMLEMVGELNEKQMDYVSKIISGVENMSTLVTNLLDLGRIEAEIGLKPEMLSIHDIISQVTEPLEFYAQQKDIELRVSATRQAVPLIIADPALLQQALHNLVENAIKFTRDGGRVSIQYRVEDSQMIFEVHDNGVGISPVDQRRLFERFYKVERRDESMQSGTGLGLAIVKSIAERHGGETWVESELGTGSTFYFSIPVYQPERG